MIDGYVYKQTAINAICQDWCNRDYCGDCFFHGARQAIAVLKALPDADVQPVRHGQWEEDVTDFGEPVTRCTACGVVYEYGHDEDYCGCCGARMDGDTYGCLII